MDDAIGLLTRGYRLSSHIWQRVEPGRRAAPMTLLGRDAILVRGAEGVATFYDEENVARHGAMPAIVQRVLFGAGSVHSLDGASHRHRKSTFVDLAYDDDQVERMTRHLDGEWRAELSDWRAGGRRSAYTAAVGAFGRAVMRWADVPGTSAAHTRWAGRLAQIVDGFGAPYSPAFLLAVANRWWSDRHTTRLIEAVRNAELTPRPGTALDEWARHRDEEGALLAPRLAGVELQNSLRPMIAVARFVAFAAKELHARPEWRARIAAETDERETLVGGGAATAFAQEVRRTAPFVPMLPGWAKRTVEVDGQRVDRRGRVVFDILGTDTDNVSWDRPAEFLPERFFGISDYEAMPAFVPHGGGDVRTGHRCPGEKLAIAGLAAAIAALSDPSVTIMKYGLEVNPRRLPTMPASGGRVAASPAGDTAASGSHPRPASTNSRSTCPFSSAGGSGTA
ncbi:cytochrome P450 [Microbacterium sp. ET2]|uniref:cytochrome P450 n=1 Tax=Microbacterium albipurpureum TaxID=3050384 RepID=UPI00259D10D0|nr:cytochrome P450 [Microbacterium sp. ET2 (Ac-2212)]WJL96936.1 cytochrome P450 [Microbacterium sp. ET2 (Ac-2212)]